ncbi:MAG: ATP phosphoribosyltransferase regulatory subunit [Sandaracinaceae bacterium]
MTAPLAPPAGMRDLLPPDASLRDALATRLTHGFAAWGYELVTTPPFEHAEVIERGLSSGVDRRDLFRFVEPESGEVALMRPDITPQIARIVATQLRSRPAPYRLCYRGSVVRRRRFRARTQRLHAQVGVEHIGSAGVDADVEIIRLAAQAARAAGLDRFRVELAAVGLVRRALGRLPEGIAESAEEALSLKDLAGLERALRLRRVEARTASQLEAAATELCGEPARVLRAAARRFDAPEDRRILAELRAIVRATGDLDVLLDLGEVRGAAYYTGASFALLARGPGEPIASGGRYDGLLGKFGADLPATGFAMDLGHLEWALDEAGSRGTPDRPVKLLVVGKRDRRSALAASLRERGWVAAQHDGGLRTALDYGRAWGYDAVVSEGDRVTRVSDGATRRAARPDWDAIARWARGGSER